MADTNSTVQFKADISQLKSAMQTAQRQVKLANSEFKAASAGMDDWADSADGLRAKLKQLDTTLKSQKTQLSLLEDEYDKTVDVYGENSAAADRVKISINNMKASIAKTESQIDTYTSDLKDCEEGTGRFADELEDTEDAIKDTTSATADLSDGFTVTKGVIADLVSTGIKYLISGLKDVATEAYAAYEAFDEGQDIIVAKTGATGEALENLTDTYVSVMNSVITESDNAGNAVGTVATKFDLTGDALEELSTKFIKYADLNNTDVVSSIESVQAACEAWGVEAENAGDVLDLLNATSQDTGASVDSLSSSLTTNAASLKDMGFNLEEAVSFLGDLETSGVDSSSVMTGLKKALVNASKEGKTTSEALSELQESMESADSSAEATTEAIELFGSKAGASIAEACQNGRLNFNDLGEAMTDYVGNVDTTYDATLDGADKIKLAWQGVKTEVGATVGSLLDEYSPEIEGIISTVKDGAKDILTSVKENAPQIKSTLMSVVEWAKSSITWIIENFDGIKTVVQAVGTVLIATFAVSKIVSFISTITTMVTTFAALKAATEAAQASQLLLNAAQLASPVGLVTAAVAGLAAGIIYLASKTEEAEGITSALNDAEKEQIAKVDELAESYKELNSARDEEVAAINTEYSYYESLADELDSLVDANGNVKEGYEDRVNFILTTLNDAVGTEMELVDGVIQNYQDEKDAIYKLIEAKKAEAVLSANEEAYTTAIQNQNEALQNYITTQGIFQQNVSDMEEAQTAYNNIMNMTAEEYANLNGLTYDMGAASQQLANDQETLSNELLSAKAAVGESRVAMETAKTTYEGYQATIKNYEGLSSAIISGDSDKISQALLEMEYSFQTAETSTRESLEQQVENYETNLESLKQAIEDGTPGVTQEMVDQAQSMVDAAKAELDKLPDEAAESANSGASSFANTLGSSSNQTKVRTNSALLLDAANSGVKPNGEEQTAGDNFTLGYIGGMKLNLKGVNDTANNMGSNAVSALNEGQDSHSPSNATYTSGENFGQGFINGMESKSSSIWQKAYSLAKTALSALKSGQEEGSPSKLTKQSGIFFGEGYNVGIESMKTSIKKTAGNLATTAYNSLRTTQQEGSPSKLTYASGVNFTKGYINGISSMQKQLQVAVKNMTTTALKTAMSLDTYNFSEVAQNAADYLADELSNKTDYMIAKITYQNEAKLADFDSTISKLESERDSKTSALQAKIDATKDDATKKTLKNQKATIEKQYATLIATQNKYKTAYQTASSEMLTEFTEAVNSYSSKAQDLINSTIGGVSDKYQEKYDELINKQNTLISKLKSAGDLFEVSGAGIMTVNDITEQTKRIKDYTAKLQAIKEKVSADLFDEIAGYDMKEGSAFIDRLLALSDADLQAYSDAYDEKMSVAEKLSEDLYKDDFKGVANDYQTELEKAFKGLPDQLEAIGNDAMKGFVNGLTQNTDYLDSNVRMFVNGMVDQFKSMLKIKSPSRVMMDIGGFTGQGFVNGLKEKINNVKQMAETMAQAVATPLDGVKTDIGSMKANIGDSQGLISQTTNVVNNYNLTQNNTSPKSLTALETYQARRQQIAMVKAMT